MTATADRGLEVQATITGDVGGQVAIGQNIAQYRVETGGTLIVQAPSGQQTTCRPRPLPIAMGGRRPPDLFGRDSEIRAAARALEGGDIVEFHGPPGIGKTCLLKYLVQRPPSATARYGVVYHDALGEPVEDVLAVLHEIFYEVPEGVKPSEADLRHDLREVAALVVLDELEVGRGGLDDILDTLPAATFLVASTRRSLWGGGHSVGLGGLPGDAAVELLQRELGRELDDEEKEAARTIVQGVGAQPLRLLEIAALLSELGSELSGMAGRLAAGCTPDEVAAMLMETLSEDERAVLSVLTALGGATLPADQLAELTGVDDVESVVDSLLRMRLIKANSPRYNVTDAPTLRRVVDHGQWNDRLVSHFSDWVARNGHRPAAVIEERQAVLSVLERAADRAAWNDLLRLARAAEGAFFVTKRWGGWKAVLDHQLNAAERVGDRSAAGWAHHQLGSRALCLGDHGRALNHLTRALAIREVLGEEAAAATTRHNLSLLAEGGRRRPEAVKATPAVVAAAPLAGVPLLAIVLGLVAVGLLAVGATVTLNGDGNGSGSSSRAGAIAALLRADPGRLDFGEQPPGGAGAVRGMTLTNDDREPVTIGSVAVGGELGTFRIERDGCSGSSLPPGTSCPIEVRFVAPVVGAHGADLVVDAGEDGELRVPLTGSGGGGGGEPPPASSQAVVEPGSVEFGTRPVSAEPVVRPVSVLNTGSNDIRVASVDLSGRERADFAVVRDGCNNVTLRPGGRCVVQVSFVPRGAGSRRGVLAVALAAPGSGLSAALSGTGTGTVQPPNGGGPTIDPVGPQEFTYGSPVSFAVTGSYPGRAGVALSFDATGLPAGVGLRQAGPGRAEIVGTVLDRPGEYQAQLTLRAANGQQTSTALPITVVPATLRLSWIQPLVDLSAGSPAVAVALVTQTTGTGVDLTTVPLTFEVTNTLTRAVTVLPATSAPDGRVTLQLRPGQLQPGLYTVRALVDPANPNYRMAGPAPVALAVNTDILGATVYTLSDLLSGTAI